MAMLLMGESVDNTWKKRIKQAADSLEFFPAGTTDWMPKPGDRWVVPDYLRETKSRWAKALVKLYEHPMSFPGCISPDAGNILRALVINIAPRNVMEIGSYLGASTIWISSALADTGKSGRLHSIDLFNAHKDSPWSPGESVDHPFEFVQKQLRKCRLDNFVELHKGKSAFVSPRIAKELDGGLEFIFIDGDHSIEGFMADFDALEPFVSTGGYILLHDVFPQHCDSDGPAFLLSSENFPREHFELCHVYTAPLNFGFCLLRKIR